MVDRDRLTFPRYVIERHPQSPKADFYGGENLSYPFNEVWTKNIESAHQFRFRENAFIAMRILSEGGKGGGMRVRQVEIR